MMRYITAMMLLLLLPAAILLAQDTLITPQKLAGTWKLDKIVGPAGEYKKDDANGYYSYEFLANGIYYSRSQTLKHFNKWKGKWKLSADGNKLEFYYNPDLPLKINEAYEIISLSDKELVLKEMINEDGGMGAFHYRKQ